MTMTYRVGIIGDPLKHSLSPAFQQAAIRHCGQDAVYEVWETPAEGLGKLLAWLRETWDAWGANVTVPHKEAVVGLLDRLDPAAERVGAVNTVVAHNGLLTGYNTDVPGFLKALSQDAGFDAAGRRVLVLGAGGVARAVVTALAQAGAAQVTIANRTVARAEALVELARSRGLEARAVDLDDQALRAAGAGASWELVVNATSMGMRHSAAEGESPMPAALIPTGALVYDLVYNPPVTPLLEAARAAGARTLSGLSMLVYQGAESFTLWTGMEAPVDVMMSAARQALEGA
jgi:shikimate dehydrogenase